MAEQSDRSREVRIACIGGGGRRWAREMIVDMALCPQLSGHIALYDVNFAAARRNAQWATDVFAREDALSTFTASAHRKLAAALRGADFVVIAIQPGPISMMASDIDIPRQYGVLHTVGDTAGPAGVVRALRSVPLYMEYAHQVMAECPNAWVINLTNPMALCVAALYAAEPRIKAIGYCHEVMYAKRNLAKMIARCRGGKVAHWREIEMDYCGVNHFVLATAASWQAEDLFPMLREHMAQEGFFDDRSAVAQERKGAGRYFEGDGLVAFDLLRRFGVFGAAGDRHLVEFLPWYLTSEEALHRWGVLLTPASYRLASRPDDRTGERPEQPAQLRRSDQEYPDQMLALLGMGDIRAAANVPNRGQVADWPLGAVIETNALYRHDAVEPTVTRPLPPICSGWQKRIIEQHQATLEAAVTRDRDLAFQAICHDPLVRIPTDCAWEMLNEMLAATRDMLPGWDL